MREIGSSPRHFKQTILKACEALVADGGCRKAEQLVLVELFLRLRLQVGETLSEPCKQTVLYTWNYCHSHILLYLYDRRSFKTNFVTVYCYSKIRKTYSVPTIQIGTT